jgi:hypothetical protein
MSDSAQIPGAPKDMPVEPATFDAATLKSIRRVAGHFWENAGYPLGRYAEFRERVRKAFAVAHAARARMLTLEEEISATPPPSDQRNGHRTYRQDD